MYSSIRYRLGDFHPLAYQGVNLSPVEVLPAKAAICAVPAVLFAVKIRQQQVGWCDLRLAVNDDLIRYAGQIGYQIFPQYRRQGLAKKACLALSLVAKEHGIWPWVITTNHDNLASQALLTSLGARYLNQVRVPVNHELYARGDRLKNRYHWS